MGRSCAFLDYVTINIIFYFAVQFRVQPGMLHVWVSMFLIPCMYIGAVTVLTSTEYGTLSYGYGNCIERILHEASFSFKP